MTKKTTRRALSFSLTLSLTASTAFAGPVVELTGLPQSAVVFGPYAGAMPSLPPDVAALISRNQAMVDQITAQGPTVMLEAGEHVLFVPRQIAAGAKALAIPTAAGGKAEFIPLTLQMGRDLQAQLPNGDAAILGALGKTFDASQAAAGAPAGEVNGLAVAGEFGAPTRLTSAATARAGARPRRGPPAPKTDGDAAKGRPTWEKAQPLPAHEDRESEFESADQAVEMHATHDYEGAKSVDPSDLLLQDVKDYIATKDMPDEKKHFIFKYFEIGDAPTGHSKAVQAVALLVKAGIKTTIITDINQSMEGVFPNNELHNADFESATPKENGPGRAMKYFLAKPSEGGLGFGWNYGEGKFTIVSGVPLFNPRDKSEKPLAHDKGYVAEGPDGMAWRVAGDGTANMNATEDSDGGTHGGRYNAVMRSFDRVSNTIDLEHALGEIAAFNKRDKFSKDIDPALHAPQRVHYGKKGLDGQFVRSGEWREHAYTNGRQNPNDRIIAQLQLATQALLDAKANGGKPKVEIDEIIFSHFVLTDSPEVDALRKYLDALRAFYPTDYQKRVKIFGVFDQQFISPDGFGEAAALDGILVQRPMGKSIFPFRTEYMAMMKLYGYVRLLAGVGKINTEGAPTKVHLWHDKTTIIKMRELNEQTGGMEAWTYAWTRSLNNSGHFQSLESQDMYRLKATSRLAQQFEDRIKKVVAAEPEYAIELDKAIAMTVLAHFTGHTLYDEGIKDYAEKLIDALTHLNIPTVKSIVEKVMGIETRSVKDPDTASVSDRIARFTGFLEKYAAARKADPGLSFLTYRKALNIMVSIAEDNPWAMRTALDLLLWKPGQDPAQLEAAMRKAWTEWLQMTEPFPEPKTRDGQTGGNA